MCIRDSLFCASRRHVEIPKGRERPSSAELEAKFVREVHRFSSVLQACRSLPLSRLEPGETRQSCSPVDLLMRLERKLDHLVESGFGFSPALCARMGYRLSLIHI